MDQFSRRNFVKVAALAGVAAAGTAVAGCSSSAGSASASGSASAAAAKVKPVILVVSFGTSFNNSRHLTIGAIEDAIREKYTPDYEVRRAFTAQIIIDKLQERDGISIDNVEQALDRLIADGVKDIIVQPTHLMAGFEYTDLKDALEEYKGKFSSIKLGEPLLTSDDDYKKVAKAAYEALAKYDDGATALCYMGHGTEADSNSTYGKLQGVFKDLGYERVLVGTVEAEPTFDDVIAAAQAAGLTKAVLRPLMVVAGDHANNDMADESDPESFAAKFKAAGFQVTSVIEGLGQLVDIEDIYVAHVAEAKAL